jgi:cytochrome P450
MNTAASTPSPISGDPISDDWCAHHFDHLSPEFSRELHETLAHMRAHCPVAHSEEHGGFWVVTSYEDVLRVAQDWRTFSSAQGVSVPQSTMVVTAIPEHLDPPLHTTYKRLINAYFTQAAVAPYEQPTRDLVTRLIDGFIEAGECDFMADFARPFPGLAFFDFALNAPPDDVVRINELATRATVQTGHLVLVLVGEELEPRLGNRAGQCPSVRGVVTRGRARHEIEEPTAAFRVLVVDHLRGAPGEELAQLSR